MKKFIYKTLIVLLPFLLIVILLIGLFVNYNIYRLYDFKKTYPDYPFLVGTAYHDNITRYIKLVKPLDNIKVITIGSSRVLQFSQDMFEEPFYNLGYTAGSVYQMAGIIKDKNLKNKTLIVGLDQWCFNSNWPGYSDALPLDRDFNVIDVGANLNLVRLFLKRKIYPVLFNSDSVRLIGIGAKMALQGIINDGSFYYGELYEGRLTDNKKLLGIKYNFHDVRERIKKGERKFEYGVLADQGTINEVGRLIELCRSMNDHLILFFPPFPPSIDHLMADSKKYAYINDASNKITALCKAQGVPFYDFTSMDSVTDNDFIDGMHGGKRLYYKIATHFGLKLRNTKFLNPFENTDLASYIDLRKRFFERKGR